MVDKTGMTGHQLKLVPPPEQDAHDLVIVTHGFLSNGRSMDPIADQLSDAGYETLVWEYPSLRGSVLSHASRLVRVIRESMVRPEIRQIHFVAHSMGGIIARAAISTSHIETFAAERCGRLLMMAPPNKGSWLTRMPLGPFRGWFPQLAEMGEHERSFVNQLPRPHVYEVGVLAAAQDWIVSEPATHLDGQSAHTTLATSHQRLVQHPTAIELTLRFLAEGHFDAESSVTEPARQLTQPEHQEVPREEATRRAA